MGCADPLPDGACAKKNTHDSLRILWCGGMQALYLMECPDPSPTSVDDKRRAENDRRSSNKFRTKLLFDRSNLLFGLGINGQ